MESENSNGAKTYMEDSRLLFKRDTLIEQDHAWKVLYYIDKESPHAYTADYIERRLIMIII